MPDSTMLAVPEDSGYSTTSTPACVSSPKEPKQRNRSTGKRISHRKSRKGCKSCKDRKVKCDELHPSCSRCERLELDCEYPHLQRPSSPNNHYALLELRPSPSPSTSGPPDLDLLQLELLHTWGTFTYTTMPWSPALTDFWRVTVPSLALKHSYIMRSLLAIPALHLAHLRPEQKGFYVSAALEHHLVASEAARVLLENEPEKNAVPLFLFSSLSLIIVLATPHRPSEEATSDDKASYHDLLVVLKGIKGILETAWDSLPNSPLAPLINFGSERVILQQPMFRPDRDITFISTSLDSLQVRLNTQEMDLDELQAYNKVIDALRDATDLVHLWEVPDAMLWVYRSLEHFIPLLESRTQEALVLMAHFAVLLKSCETKWWTQGWATRIMSSVYQQLDDDHKLWIYGPVTEIGFVFPMY